MLLAALAHLAIEKGCVLVLAHLQDLVIQLAKILDQEGLSVGLLMQGHLQLDCSVTVVTPQSLLATFPAFLEARHLPVATLFIDEVHHAVDGSAYKQILKTFDANSAHEQVSAVRFTATSYRNDTTRSYGQWSLSFQAVLHAATWKCHSRSSAQQNHPRPMDAQDGAIEDN